MNGRRAGPKPRNGDSKPLARERQNVIADPKPAQERLVSAVTEDRAAPPLPRANNRIRRAERRKIIGAATEIRITHNAPRRAKVSRAAWLIHSSRRTAPRARQTAMTRGSLTLCAPPFAGMDDRGCREIDSFRAWDSRPPAADVNTLSWHQYVSRDWAISCAAERQAGRASSFMRLRASKERHRRARMVQKPRVIMLACSSSKYRNWARASAQGQVEIGFDQPRMAARVAGQGIERPETHQTSARAADHRVAGATIC